MNQDGTPTTRLIVEAFDRANDRLLHTEIAKAVEIAMSYQIYGVVGNPYDGIKFDIEDDEGSTTAHVHTWMRSANIQHIRIDRA